MCTVPLFIGTLWVLCTGMCTVCKGLFFTGVLSLKSSNQIICTVYQLSTVIFIYVKKKMRTTECTFCIVFQNELCAATQSLSQHLRDFEIQV